jgi:pimeloyl-ACP methyl ester carboxylesterase
MSFIEVGKGPPLVLIPGIQGRWEYLRPAIDALATSFRTLTFPLRGEPGCDAPLDPALGIDNDARQIAAVLDRSGVGRAIVCGISFGGLPAIRFAAVAPERTAALILASVPGPHWHMRPRHQLYARAPWLFGPLFLAESPWRLRDELRTALPRAAARRCFVRGQLGTLLRARISPARMAWRAALIASPHVSDDCARIVAPTLVVTGEPGLDRVVRVDDTLAYLQLISGARHSTLDRTGHLGSITRPEAFASLVREFVEHSCGTGSFDLRHDRVAGRDQGSSDAA